MRRRSDSTQAICQFQPKSTCRLPDCSRLPRCRELSADCNHVHNRCASRGESDSLVGNVQRERDDDVVFSAGYSDAIAAGPHPASCDSSGDRSGWFRIRDSTPTIKSWNLAARAARQEQRTLHELAAVLQTRSIDTHTAMNTRCRYRAIRLPVWPANTASG